MKKQASTYYIDEAKPVARAIADLEGASDFFSKTLFPQLQQVKNYAEYAADLTTALATFQTIAKMFDDYLINDPQEIANELNTLDAIRERSEDEHYQGRPVPVWLSDILSV